MHHRTGLSFVNNISIRNRPPPLVKIILLKEKTDLKKKKKKRVSRWNSTLDLDSSTSPWTAKAISEYSNRGNRFDLRFEEYEKKVFRACLYRLMNETETNNKFCS